MSLTNHDARRRAERDEGSVLMIAIGYVLLFSLLAITLLDATSTGLKETSLMHVQRTNMYTSEGAVNAAVQRIKNDFVTNISAAQTGAWDCAGAPSNLGPTVVDTTSGLNQTSATVTCVSGTTSTYDNGAKPPDAILTLAGGLTVDKKGTARIGGPVRSGGSISVGDRNGVLDASGFSITAKSTCNFKGGSIGSHYTPTPTCKTGIATVDPQYAVPSGSGTQSLPSCSSAVVTFAPGVYNDANALNNMFKGNKGNPCTGKSFVFAPGTYVFNFNVGPQREWKIADGTAWVVAGAKGGWSSKPPFPGGCLFDGVSASSPGTTFVFQNGSRLNIDKGHFEICPPNTGTQRIAIAGDSTQSGKILRTGDKAAVSIKGTVYAPRGDVELHSNHALVPVVTRGIIARSVKIEANVYNVPVVQLPTDQAHAVTDAVLQLTATINGGDYLDAQVTLHNEGGMTTVQVTDWDVHS